MKLPAFQSRHAAAQSRGEFSPYHTQNTTMNPTPIITPARRTYSLNRRKHTALRRRLLVAGVVLASALFWGAVVLY